MAAHLEIVDLQRAMQFVLKQGAALAASDQEKVVGLTSHERALLGVYHEFTRAGWHLEENWAARVPATPMR